MTDKELATKLADLLIDALVTRVVDALPEPELEPDALKYHNEVFDHLETLGVPAMVVGNFSSVTVARSFGRKIREGWDATPHRPTMEVAMECYELTKKNYDRAVAAGDIVEQTDEVRN